MTTPDYPPPGAETREFLRLAALIEAAAPHRRGIAPPYVRDALTRQIERVFDVPAHMLGTVEAGPYVPYPLEEQRQARAEAEERRRGTLLPLVLRDGVNAVWRRILALRPTQPKG